MGWERVTPLALSWGWSSARQTWPGAEARASVQWAPLSHMWRGHTRALFYWLRQSSAPVKEQTDFKMLSLFSPTEIHLVQPSVQPNSTNTAEAWKPVQKCVTLQFLWHPTDAKRNPQLLFWNTKTLWSQLEALFFVFLSGDLMIYIP